MIPQTPTKIRGAHAPKTPTPAQICARCAAPSVFLSGVCTSCIKEVGGHARVLAGYPDWPQPDACGSSYELAGFTPEGARVMRCESCGSCLIQPKLSKPSAEQIHAEEIIDKSTQDEAERAILKSTMQDARSRGYLLIHYGGMDQDKASFGLFNPKLGAYLSISIGCPDEEETDQFREEVKDEEAALNRKEASA